MAMHFFFALQRHLPFEKQPACSHTCRIVPYVDGVVDDFHGGGPVSNPGYVILGGNRALGKVLFEHSGLLCHFSLHKMLHVH
jgi:hypothetical protein